MSEPTVPTLDAMRAFIEANRDVLFVSDYGSEGYLTGRYTEDRVELVDNAIEGHPFRIFLYPNTLQRVYECER